MSKTTGKIKILLLEDSPSDAKLVLHTLKKSGLNFDYRHVVNKGEYIESLKGFGPDVILSDHLLASFNSSEALSIARKHAKDTPFILVTGTVSEEFAVSIIKQGASDYLLKNNLSRLAVAVNSALAQKALNEKLKTSEEQFQHTIDGMIDGVQIINFSWQFIYVNNTIAWQYNRAKHELLGRTIQELNPGIETTEMFQQLKKCMHERIVVGIENVFTYPDGGTGWLKLNIQPVPQGILIVSTDITEKKKAYEQLRIQHEKIMQTNADIDRFLYSVSHELRTPICNGLGLIELLRIAENQEDTETAMSMLELCIKNQDAMLHKIRLYTEIMRQDIDYEEIDFQLIFDECLVALQHLDKYRQVSVNLVVEGLYPVISNKKRLQILLTNLISNGIEFCQPVHPYVNVKISKATPMFSIEVSDNGCGIVHEHLNKVFDAFFKTTNRHNAQGLGLYFADKIVETLNGKIHLQSVINTGTTVKVNLPNALSES